MTSDHRVSRNKVGCHALSDSFEESTDFLRIHRKGNCGLKHAAEGTVKPKEM